MKLNTYYDTINNSHNENLKYQFSLFNFKFLLWFCHFIFFLHE